MQLYNAVYNLVVRNSTYLFALSQTLNHAGRSYNCITKKL